ncbi:MAG: site-specific integrase, partial [Hyphomonadaceae bacterium]|nr:site-specific integrase [Clostridia bacterium]
MKVVMTLLPIPAKNFLSYLSNIRGRSNNTIYSYAYDLIKFFKFMKPYKGLCEMSDEIVINDLTV